MPAAPAAAPSERRSRSCYGGDSETSCHSESRQNLPHDFTSMMGVLSRNPTAPRDVQFPFIGERRLNEAASIQPFLRISGGKAGRPSNVVLQFFGMRSQR
jgi:hypothetical protein